MHNSSLPSANIPIRVRAHADLLDLNHLRCVPDPYLFLMPSESRSHFYRITMLSTYSLATKCTPPSRASVAPLTKALSEINVSKKT